MSSFNTQDTPVVIYVPGLWNEYMDLRRSRLYVSLSTNNYPRKAYFIVLLSTGEDAANSQLQSQLYFLDNANLDDPKIVGGTHSRLLNRNNFTKQSKIFDMEGPLYDDIFRMDKCLLNGVDLHLKLFRNRAPFIFMSGETNPSYKLELLDVAFKACMVRIDSGLLVNHAELLKNVTAKYPLTRTEVKMNTLSSGSGSFIWQNIWSNNLPAKA